MNPNRSLVNIMFVVDTNCVNARQSMPEMNRLEQWAENGIITLETTEVAQSEMIFGNSQIRKAKAYSFVFTMSEIFIDEERKVLSKIENILFPLGTTNQNQKNDVEIVFNAFKYSPLITNDGGSKSQPSGILGNRDKLLSLGIKVITPQEAIQIVLAALEARDNYARQWHSLHGGNLPFWVGQDINA